MPILHAQQLAGLVPTAKSHKSHNVHLYICGTKSVCQLIKLAMKAISEEQIKLVVGNWLALQGMLKVQCSNMQMRI